MKTSIYILPHLIDSLNEKFIKESECFKSIDEFVSWYISALYEGEMFGNDYYRSEYYTIEKALKTTKKKRISFTLSEEAIEDIKAIKKEGWDREISRRSNSLIVNVALHIYTILN